jgi:FtsH-binding integral membrane protein
MFKAMMNMKSKMTFARNQGAGLLRNATPKRMFSYQQMPNSGPGVGTMLGVGLGTAGLMYLMYHGRTLASQRNMTHPTQQMNFFHPEVQNRISKTLSYFGGGLLITGGLVGALRNSKLAYMNPWAMLALSLGTMIGTMATNYQTQPVLKHAFWLSFMGTMALSMVPLINMASMPIIFDAMFATGFTMGGLGLIAYNAPSEQFLRWGGMLGMGCAAMIGVSVAQMFWPSPALFNFWLYGGLLLFSAFTLYDVQKIIHNAKSKPAWDPIGESLGIYLDAIILFERFLIIFMNNKKK